ncbi:MAG: DUF4276 family protein [Roseomonas sp.]|nr:DUF4276 family protein [Roseomonas sp.]
MRLVEVLVEEPSMEAALQQLLPRLLSGRARWKIINLGSKHALFAKAEARLRAYRRRIADGEALRVVVVVDQDNDACAMLKARLEDAAKRAGLATKTVPDRSGAFAVVTRIAVLELESWFLGDPAALRASFPRLPTIKLGTTPFRNPENGGTWEALHRFLRRHGYYPGGYPKIEAARLIGRHLKTEGNRARSFGAFCEGVIAAATGP